MEENEEEDCELKWQKPKEKTQKKWGLDYKMNKRTISLKGENKIQEKHEGRRSNTKT
jgi:hypothetical protein